MASAEVQVGGDWVILPLSDSEISKIVNSFDDAYGQSIFNDTYERLICNHIDISKILLNEYSNYSVIKLNAFVRKLQTFNDVEQAAFYAIAEAKQSVEEAIEIMDFCEYNIWYGCYTLEDIGYRCANCVLVDGVENFLDEDYAALGKEMVENSEFIEFEYGYIEIF